MSTAVINIKTDQKVKEEAKKIASEMGISLSGVINTQLRQFIRTKTLLCTLDTEIPTKKLLQEIEQAKIDRKNGDVVSFDNVDDALEFLDK